MKTIRTIALLLAALTLFLTGCGSRDSESAKNDESEKTDASYEEWCYTEDGILQGVGTFDGNGQFISFYMCDSNGEKQYVGEERYTDNCRNADDSEVRNIDGVETIAVRERFVQFLNGVDPEMRSVGNIYVYGYNSEGNLLARQILAMLPDGEFVPIKMDIYELDEYGKPILCTSSAPNGDVLEETVFENEYDNDRLVRAKQINTSYGLPDLDPESGEVVTSWDSSPTTSTVICEYKY